MSMIRILKYSLIFGTWFSSSFGVAQDVTDNQESVVRLLSGSTSYEGVVEYRFRSEPGLICDPDWSENEANVTCHQLGYQYGRGVKPVSLGPLSGTIFYHNYFCDGTYQQIGDCFFTVESSDVQCSPDHIAQVSCGPPRDYDLRMTGSNYSEQGRLEVFLDDEWGYVRSSHLFPHDHDVVCRQLGYAGGVQRVTEIDSDAFARPPRPILIENLHCGGDIVKITDCPTLWLSSQLSLSPAMDDYEEIMVLCFPHDNVANHPIRFRDENGVINQDYGAIEIYHDGIWGPICDTIISLINHQIVCEQLGHTNLTNAATLHNDHRIYTSPLPVWFPEIACTSRFAQFNIVHRGLYECVHEPWGTKTSGDCVFGLVAATCVDMNQVNPTNVTDQPDSDYPTNVTYQLDSDLTSNYTGSGPEMRSDVRAWKVILITVAIMIPIQRP